MDGSCVRCGQHIPAWLTFTLGPNGRVYCSEHCQRLDEQSRETPTPGRLAGDRRPRKRFRSA